MADIKVNDYESFGYTKKTIKKIDYDSFFVKPISSGIVIVLKSTGKTQKSIYIPNESVHFYYKRITNFMISDISDLGNVY